MATQRKTSTKSKAPAKRNQPKPQAAPPPEEMVNEETTPEQASSPLPETPSHDDGNIYVLVKDIFVPANPEDGTYRGVVNAKPFKRTKAGALKLVKGQPLDPACFHAEVWEKWIKSGKVAKQEAVAIIGHRKALDKAIKLVHDADGSLQTFSLRRQGGFNTRTDRNAGIHFAGTLGE